MAVQNKVRPDLIPLKAGVVRLTPLDANGNPIYEKAYTTKREFLTSTQITTSRTSESLPNGNGSDKDFPVDERHTLVLVSAVDDPKFHAMVAGFEYVDTPKPSVYDTTIVPDGSGEVDLTGDHEPVSAPDDPDGKIRFEIRDSFNNLLEETTGEVTEATQYKYDQDTKKLTFDTSLANIALSCVYYESVREKNGVAYQASPTLKQNRFRVEVFAEMRSADTEEEIRYYSCMYRATPSGDIPQVTTQKSISSPITYNFQSAPVPVGMSAYYVSFTPTTTA